MTTLMLANLLAACLAVGQASPSPTTVRLTRTTVPVTENGRPKNFYSATIKVGQPAQEFHVAFDLGGGATVLPSISCRSPACLERRRYDKWASDSAEDIQADGRLVDANAPKVKEHTKGRDKGTLDFLSADLGKGRVVGNFVRDRICIGGEDDGEEKCMPLAVLVAYDMSDAPFGAEPLDGTIGLSLDGLSVSTEFNFLDALKRVQGGARPNNFGLRLGGEGGGEITFGAFHDDVKQLSHPLEWVTVAEPEEGRWQVAISAIRVGNNTLQACKGGDCRAALDFGASLLSVPPGLAGGMEKALEGLAVPSGYGDGCQITVMPDIQLVLQNNVVLTLPAEDYVSHVSGSAKKSILSGPSQSCKPSLSHHDLEASVGQGLFVLGESVLRRYYTFFDGDSMQVGFSLAAGAKKGGAFPPMLEAGKGKEFMKPYLKDEEEPVVVLLVQIKLHKSKTISSLRI